MDPPAELLQHRRVSAAYAAGFATSLSLIVAIGAQNAFVLRQGLARQHVLAVCGFCALADALLISAGILGLGRLSEAAPWALPALRWGGAAFLAWYGIRSLRAAWAGSGALTANGGARRSLGATLLTAAALTFLNPHVYLDTVLLIGAVAARWPDRQAFAIGAISASFAFFFALGYGARLLAPVFARRSAWRVLDSAIGALMLVLAASLVTGG